MENHVVCIGLDIGGANLKCSAVEAEAGGKFRLLYSTVRDFTLNASGVVGEVAAEVGGADAVGVTCTAEYSRRYFRTIADGISHYVRDLAAIEDVPVLWVALDGGMVPNERNPEPYRVAAANWVASAIFAGRHLAAECIFVDVGSTTADIIPVASGKPALSGRMDWERLGSGALVYTGAVNTPVGSIVRRITVGGTPACVSTEVFSISGDIHLMLGHLSELEFRAYTRNTANPAECATRLAHMLCADDNLLDGDTLTDMARQVYAGQVEEIAAGIRQIYDGSKERFGGAKPPVVAAGLGADFLGAKSARKAGFEDVRFVHEKYGKSFSVSMPAVSAALMAADACGGGVDGR
jgi:(4-(4-[2-(gamma-L-glutamylamino)ethyl]phenoxymethyl)furan-2-yl)methanamine synthase